MEMFAAARTIKAAQGAEPPAVSDEDVARLSRLHFLQNIAYYQITNIVPLALIALCSVYLPDWRLMALFLIGNAASLLGMNLVSRTIRQDQDPARAGLWWRVYEMLALMSGLFWSACMLPVITTLGRDMASMFVCVVIIVSIAVTCMVVATERRLVTFFLFGALVCLVPQTIMHMVEIGPIPLVATIGLGPALIGLGDTVLVKAAEVIARHVGPHDVVGRGDGAVARWGGEEFIVLLSHCPVDQAVRIAHELRNGLAAMRGIDWPEDLVTTGSLGVAPWDPGLALHACISRADEAMYRAKQAGRNRVSVSVYGRASTEHLAAIPTGQ
ncbi:MAG: hypothetical protein B7X90_12450 [Novosphingobium sp. 17-62-19]|uniref:GGDEF domain-containing protein n=1 Tax=Novosphingobium sp. 17-62-19 TaxID=1970406 RepID=UPI000BD1D91B|nr:GGDEF domain-containing protein [Novosphingobium sp. 17-62-19]OYX93014.1 MAG: hypothetical protein B7Y74_10670 [Novosphingobium sp. 35-62-5]OZA18187.1 MAG: hypothetical protein B7X90_12450 [Novosphingobium sp. 17-62-19]HQS98443.1 GGDEF domain-containing protein [Novosphingobium sp.]